MTLRSTETSRWRWSRRSCCRSTSSGPSLWKRYRAWPLKTVKTSCNREGSACDLNPPSIWPLISSITLSAHKHIGKQLAWAWEVFRDFVGSKERKKITMILCLQHTCLPLRRLWVWFQIRLMVFCISVPSGQPLASCQSINTWKSHFNCIYCFGLLVDIKARTKNINTNSNHCNSAGAFQPQQFARKSLS